MAHRTRTVGWLSSILAAACALSGCAETSGGRPIADPSADVTATRATRTSTPSPAPSSTSAQTQPELSTMGVAPTTRETIPPNALVCLPAAAAGAATPVQIGDPAAPRIVVSLPAGWSATPTSTGVSLTGPDGMTGDVAISETGLDPAAAFGKYADALTASAPISSVSVLPAENCGYSGQRLMGMLSGGKQGEETFEDRIAHVWTNTADYLVTIHAAAPGGTPAFDSATSVLTADFAVTIP